MKITIVQGAFFPIPPLMGGAVEKVWFGLGKEFARRGHEVTHVSRTFDALPERETLDGVRHRRVPGFDSTRHLVVLKALDLIYSFRAVRALPAADILVTNTFWLPILVRSEKFGRLYVHVQRYPKGQMRFYRHAARVQCVSSHIRRAILREAPGLEGSSVVIPNPIGRPVAADDPGAGATRERQILFVGRVHPEKGLELLVRAIGLIPKDAFASWKLVIVGPSEVSAGGGGERFLAELQALAAPFQDRIEWVGPVFEPERLNDFYRRSSLFIYPSLAEKGEASPLAPLEAMVEGCPALVSDLECFHDYLSDGRTGFVFDHRSPRPAEALAATLAGLIGDPERLAAIGREGRRRAADFSFERIADRYLEDFTQLLDPSQSLQAVANSCPQR